METTPSVHPTKVPWNKGKLIGQKAPFTLKEIWAIRIQLQLSQNRRQLALFNLAVDSKLRACDLVKMRVADVCHGLEVGRRATIMQQEPTREAISDWIKQGELTPSDFLFPSRLSRSPHFVDTSVREDRPKLGFRPVTS